MLIGAIVGATGVGKTELSIDIAKCLDVEIISMDSRQIYKGMPIGTAQPTQVHRTRVKHHLVGFLEPTERYSVGKYIKAVEEIITANPGKKYLCVGGTGFYLKALQEGMSPLPEINLELRKRLENILKRKGLPFIYRWAQKNDPKGVEGVDTQNTHKIMRVLEVSLQAKQPYSELIKKKEGGWGTFPVLWLDLPREELYKRIEQRACEMIAMGWAEEAMGLAKKYGSQSPGLESLGYREIIANNGEINTEITEKIIRTTRNYAKRQITWFKNQHKTLKKSPKSDFFGKKEEILNFFT
ncbi:MAG: tRNA (adenosine(37)-N6)-dimethylallyltransferase MiaA [Fibrobacter sp.]|nr:tRNA (adenosine(37)-N6)-dimethylallyltransferase MiaA [Fibrobacter sp.]